MPRVLHRALRGALLLAALLWVPWMLAWAFDLDGVNWRVPAALAFLPYVTVLTLVVVIAALIARARLAAILALIGLVLLVAPRIGRVTSDSQPAARGPVLTIATSNIYVGEGDIERLTRLVERERVDVLAVQENTPEWDAAARRAGLRSQLPYGMSRPDARPGAAGIALWSRWPLDPKRLPGGGGRSLGGLIAIPGATPVMIRSAHPFPPFSNHNVDCWQSCTKALAQTATNAGGAIAAGDFNASLDHHPLRFLLGHGFRDASEERGLALRPTWTNGSWAALTLDHIFVTRQIAVEQVTAHDLPSSDHDVVVARLRLPR